MQIGAFSPPSPSWGVSPSEPALACCNARGAQEAKEAAEKAAKDAQEAAAKAVADPPASPQAQVTYA